MRRPSHSVLYLPSSGPAQEKGGSACWNGPLFPSTCRCADPGNGVTCSPAYHSHPSCLPPAGMAGLSAAAVELLIGPSWCQPHCCYPASHYLPVFDMRNPRGTLTGLEAPNKISIKQGLLAVLFTCQVSDFRMLPKVPPYTSQSGSPRVRYSSPQLSTDGFSSSPSPPFLAFPVPFPRKFRPVKGDNMQTAIRGVCQLNSLAMESGDVSSPVALPTILAAVVGKTLGAAPHLQPPCT